MYETQRLREVAKELSQLRHVRAQRLIQRPYVNRGFIPPTHRWINGGEWQQQPLELAH